MQGRYSIFATVGNAKQPFDRFLKAVDEAARRTGINTLIQTGWSTYRPQHTRAINFVTRPRFEELVQEADFFVTHAGAGSVMAGLRFGKLPIVMARRRGAGEMVNDHQMELATEFSRMGWCRVMSTVDELVAYLQQPSGMPPIREAFSNQLMQDLVHDFIR